MLSGLTKCALLIENSAKDLCPVDSGRLRASITHEVTDDEAIVYTNVEYAPYIEFGTGLFNPDGRKDVPWRYQDAKGNWHSTCGNKPQPFLQPALDMNREEILNILGEAVIEDVKVRLRK